MYDGYKIIRNDTKHLSCVDKIITRQQNISGMKTAEKNGKGAADTTVRAQQCK